MVAFCALTDGSAKKARTSDTVSQIKTLVEVPLIITPLTGQAAFPVGRKHLTLLDFPDAALNHASSREQELQRKPNGPLRTEIVGLLDVVIALKRGIYRLLANSKNFPKPTTDRNGPGVVVVGFPVGGNERRGGQIPAVVEVVVNKRLPGEQIDVRIPGERSDIAKQRANDPSVLQRQENRGWPGTPLAGAQAIVRGCGQQYRRTHAPEPLSREP